MIASLVLSTVLLAVPVSDPQAEARKRAAALVARLGHPSFKQRLIAAGEIEKLGSVSLVALRNGLSDPDMEIAERCRQLLPNALDKHLNEQIEIFLAKTDGAIPEDLPAIKRWVEIAGKDGESRKLYALLVREHRRLLLEIEQQPEGAGQRYAAFTQEVYNRTCLNPSENGNKPVSESELVLFLFLGADSNCSKNMGLSTRVSCTQNYNFLNSAQLNRMLTGENASEAGKKLYVAWLAQVRQLYIIRRGYQLAVAAKLKGAALAAAHTAADKTAVATVRGNALIAARTLFEPEHLQELDKLMSDQIVIGRTNIGGEAFAIELRDVALGIAIKASGQEPADYGYPNHKEGQSYGSSAYFALTNAQREVAFKKWQKWKEAHKK